MVLWNLLNGGLSHSGPLLGPSESMRGGTPDTNPRHLDDPRWKLAMDHKFAALIKNHTWDLVPLKEGANIIDCKWVYKVKRKYDGSIDRFKA
jgi:hypothetical protein